MKILDCIKKENGRWYDSKLNQYFFCQLDMGMPIDESYKEEPPIKDPEKELLERLEREYTDATLPHFNFELPTDMFYGVAFNNRYKIWKHIGENDIRKHPDIFYNHTPSLNKYKDSTILVLGGGPSTSKLLEDGQLPSYDYAWSTNFCFLNKNLPKIDLWSPTKYLFEEMPSLTNYAYDNHPDMYNFLDKNNPDIVFCEARGVLKGYKDYYKNSQKPMPKNIEAILHASGNEKLEKLYGELYLKNKYPSKTTWFHTRYRPKLGITARSIIMAITLGVKKIYTIGIDGYTPAGFLGNEEIIQGGSKVTVSKQLHSFEQEKFMPSKWKEGYGLSLDEYYAAMKQSYILFLEYLEILKKDYDFELINLSEAYPELSQFGQITKEWNKHI